MKKSAKPRAPPKPKESNFQKIAKKPRKPTPEEEAKKRQRIKDNAKSAQKVGILSAMFRGLDLTDVQMEAFVQRQPPRYMTKEQSARKKELLDDKVTLLKGIEDAEARLEVLMDPVRDVKREIGGYKSTLSYHAVELKKFLGMKEPERQEIEEMEKAKRESDSLFERAEEEEAPVKGEAGL